MMPNRLLPFTPNADNDVVLELPHLLNEMRTLDFIRERRQILILTLAFTVCVLATDIKAQSSPQESANASRAQLIEVLTKQEGLNARLRDLEEELKPENIEKSLAGIGSTHPEDLRELRRRQLEVEKSSIQSQLKLLMESKTRLETGIVQADAAAYHQSAGINPGTSPTVPAVHQLASVSRVQRRVRRAKNKPKRRRIYRLTQD